MSDDIQKQLEGITAKLLANYAFFAQRGLIGVPQHYRLAACKFLQKLQEKGMLENFLDEFQEAVKNNRVDDYFQQITAPEKALLNSVCRQEAWKWYNHGPKFARDVIFATGLTYSFTDLGIHNSAILGSFAAINFAILRVFANFMLNSEVLKALDDPNRHTLAEDIICGKIIPILSGLIEQRDARSKIGNSETSR